MTLWRILVPFALTAHAVFAANNCYVNVVPIRADPRIALVSACAVATVGDLVDDPTVLDMFAEVQQRGRFGKETESAAFIVRDENGEHRCFFWPNTFEYHRTHYPGPPPAGVVAIVHTHPYDLPLVSPGDQVTAAHFRIPVYAITVRSISEADALGRVIVVTKNHQWLRDRRRGRFCSSNSQPVLSDSK
jgi:hypothetical protein